MNAGPTRPRILPGRVSQPFSFADGLERLMLVGGRRSRSATILREFGARSLAPQPNECALRRSSLFDGAFFLCGRRSPPWFDRFRPATVIPCDQRFAWTVTARGPVILQQAIIFPRVPVCRPGRQSRSPRRASCRWAKGPVPRPCSEPGRRGAFGSGADVPHLDLTCMRSRHDRLGRGGCLPRPSTTRPWSSLSMPVRHRQLRISAPD